MRRLGRILLKALTVTSVLLFLASAGLWVRGYCAFDTLSYAEYVDAWTPSNGKISYALRIFSAESDEGMLGIQFVWHGERDADERDVRVTPEWRLNGPGAGLLYEGDRFRHFWPRTPLRFFRTGVWSNGGAIVLPLWPIIVLSGILPGLRLWRRVRRRINARKGQCRECGYDLRATPQRCPECGTVPQPSTIA